MLENILIFYNVHRTAYKAVMLIILLLSVKNIYQLVSVKKKPVQQDILDTVAIGQQRLRDAKEKLLANIFMFPPKGL